MQLFIGGQKPPCCWAKCMAFPTPLANSQPVLLPVDSHRLFRTVAYSDCTRCVVFFWLASLSESPGRLATHGWNCVLAVVRGTRCLCRSTGSTVICATNLRTLSRLRYATPTRSQLLLLLLVLLFYFFYSIIMM